MSRSEFTLRRDTAQALRKQAGRGEDERVYATVEDLVRLQHLAKGFTFLPRQPVHSILAGRHASRMRGRGLNFEEVRHYQAGDDIRMIDWKVTARTRSPHTRVFTEERDRPVLLLVDQRIGMFFGTRIYMKSVVAARAAALGAWRVLDQGDRVGAIVYGDDRLESIRPHRSRNTVMRILKTVTDLNQSLSVESPGRGNPEMFNEVLQKAGKIATHDFLVVLISDFAGMNDDTLRHLRKLSAHNDLLGCFVHDPSASHLPSSREFVITDGELQIELPTASGGARKKLESAMKGRIAGILEQGRLVQMPILPINTEEEVVDQVRRLLGQRLKAR